MRRGEWKLVREYPHDCELYDIARDRSELENVAAQRPGVVADLAAEWLGWATRVGVIPWEVTLNLYAERGQTDEEAAE